MTFPWLVYYNDQASVEDFAPYNPIVLDSDAHPPLKPLLEQEKEILGYVVLAEVETYRQWFEKVKNKGITIAENPNWPGSYSVDIRSSFW